MSHQQNHEGTSRRSFLKTTAAGALAANSVSNANAQQKKKPDFRLGGKVQGWQGMKPKSIQGKSNPTLKLKQGKTYRLTWKNLDGQPHNFAFQDKNGNNLKVITNSNGKKVSTTQTVTQNGATQTFTFTVTKKMATYICLIHPASMEGKVQVGRG